MNERIEKIDHSAVQQVTEPLEGAPTGEADILLKSLELFCHHHRLAFSKHKALHGLPLEGATVSPKTYASAAENLGLLTKPVKIKPSRVSEMVFPFLVFFKDNTVGIIKSKNASGKLEITVLDRAGNSLNRLHEGVDLDGKAAHTVCYVTKLPEEKAAFTDKPEKKRHWFWSSVRQFWPSWTYVVAATLFINILGLALPLFVMNVYDRVIPNNSISTLWALVAGVTIALSFDLLLKILRSAMIDNSSKQIDMGVSARIFEHALDVKMEHRSVRSGEIANHIREFESVREFFSSGAITSLIDLLFIGIFLALLWFIVGPLAYVPLLAVPVVLLVTLVVQVPLSNSIKRTQSASGNRHSVLVESLVGIETVKSIAAEGVLQKRWEDAVATAARAGAATRFWSSMAVYFTMFAQQAVSVIVIAWGVFLVADGDITIGALIAANILAGRILAPLGGISGTLVRAQQSLASFGNLNALMGLDRDNPKKRSAEATINAGGLELRDVEFSYPEQLSPALQGLNLRIAPGERVGIIGRVGSGKSTIGKLLTGLYMPKEGGVLVDGTDTRHLNIAELRKSSLYVGQETELFTGSLRENVLMACPEDRHRLDACLNAAGVTAFASRHPLGLEMPVGERGKSLSGGQRQTVGIARALLANPKIMFLDEPTAQMDTLTEAAFVKSFDGWLTANTTLIIATHRNTLLELVDRIIVIEDGKVAMDGPKQKVLQSLGNKPAASSGKKGGGNAKG